jgi:hypothetical protein
MYPTLKGSNIYGLILVPRKKPSVFAGIPNSANSV